jgi:hypothetical protein
MYIKYYLILEMKRKSNKRTKFSIRKYTALAPKTIKATKSVAANAIKKINFLLHKTVKTVKNTAKSIDRTTAKALRSLTKRRGRK